MAGVADTGADVEGAAAAVEKVQGNTTVECKDDPAQSAEKKEEKASYHYWHDKWRAWRARGLRASKTLRSWTTRTS
ncbi:hypothetical protein AB1Y20_017437 [Prymnesium parvum]|uniref:H(+)-exporting diphosphatase n=1 Tax=Prymnesium parvum TaxID=97485 RepID=A0AB34JKI8_PRYPA